MAERLLVVAGARALRATEGTARARGRLVEALGAGRVVDLVCPRECGPGETT